MKKIIILVVVAFLVFANTKIYVKAQNSNLIEFSLDENNSNELHALNINSVKEENGLMSQTAVVSNNHHYDSKSSSENKLQKSSASVSATDYLIAIVWGLSVLLSSLYIRKIKRLN